MILKHQICNHVILKKHCNQYKNEVMIFLSDVILVLYLKLTLIQVCFETCMSIPCKHLVGMVTQHISSSRKYFNAFTKHNNTSFCLDYTLLNACARECVCTSNFVCVIMHTCLCLCMQGRQGLLKYFVIEKEILGNVFHLSQVTCRCYCRHFFHTQNHVRFIFKHIRQTTTAMSTSLLLRRN